MTAWQILVNNEQGHTPYINFKGFLLGLSFWYNVMNEESVFYGVLRRRLWHSLPARSRRRRVRQ